MTSSIDGLNRNSSFSCPEKIPSQGKFFHKISDAGKCVIHSINNVAQSILSKCIYVASFGKYNLDNLKNYLFSDQTPAKLDNAMQPTRMAPPPPPPPPPLTMPVLENPHNRPNSIIQDTSPKKPICTLEYNNADSIANLPLEESNTCSLDNNVGSIKEKPKKFIANVGNIAQEALAAFNKRKNKNKI